MTKPDFYGAAQSQLGETERKLGAAIGSGDLQADGVKKELKGAAQETSAKVRKAAQTAADRIGDGAAAAAERGREVFDRASEGAQQLKDRVDPFVTERPYAALGIGLAVGASSGCCSPDAGRKSFT